MADYIIKKWKAIDRTGSHPQYAAFFNSENIGGQDPKQTLNDVKKIIQSHHDYETFKKFKEAGKPLDARFSKAKYKLEFL